MANEVEIKVTAKDDASDTLKKTESNVKSLSQTVDNANSSLKSGQGDTDKYASGIERVGEAGGSAETKFLGLGAGISGVSTIMQGGGPEDYAMALADLGDSVEHTVVPAVKGLVNQVGGLGNVMVGAAGMAGAGALLFAIHEIGKAAHEARIKDLAEEFEQTGTASKELAEAIDGDVFAMGNMSDVFDALLEKSPALAQSYLDQAVAQGLNAEAAASAQEAIDAVADSEERLADSIQATNDAYQAQFDPVFAAIDAQNKLTDAQDAAAAAAHEFGATSREAADANLAVAQAAAGSESALLGLESAVKSGDVSVSSMQQTLQRWVREGKITAGQASTVAARIGGVTSAANRVPASVATTLHANDRATPTIRSVEGAVEGLDGRSATIHIGATLGANVGRILAGNFAHGGITGAAIGGVHGGMRLVGEHGPEIVSIPAGSMVKTAGDTRSMMDRPGHAEGLTVNIFAQGSIMTERDLVAVIRDAGRAGAFRGVLESA